MIGQLSPIPSNSGSTEDNNNHLESAHRAGRSSSHATPNPSSTASAIATAARVINRHQFGNLSGSKQYTGKLWTSQLAIFAPCLCDTVKHTTGTHTQHCYIRKNIHTIYHMISPQKKKNSSLYIFVKIIYNSTVTYHSRANACSLNRRCDISNKKTNVHVDRYIVFIYWNEKRIYKWLEIIFFFLFFFSNVNYHFILNARRSHPLARFFPFAHAPLIYDRCVRRRETSCEWEEK